MDFEALARAMLADVGLSFEDVVDVGRSWRFEPAVGPISIHGRPQYAGSCKFPNPCNLMSRRRCLISLTGTIDSEWMLYVLAHECGHAAIHSTWSSTKDYIKEFEAEMYAIEAIERHVGRPPHPFLIDRAKKYVRLHCWLRQRIMGDRVRDHRDWSPTVIEWCGFKPVLDTHGE